MQIIKCLMQSFFCILSCGFEPNPVPSSLPHAAKKTKPEEQTIARIRIHRSLNNILVHEFQRQCISLGAWGRERRSSILLWIMLPSLSQRFFLGMEDGTTGIGSRNLLHISITKEVMLLGVYCVQL